MIAGQVSAARKHTHHAIVPAHAVVRNPLRTTIGQQRRLQARTPLIGCRYSGLRASRPHPRQYLAYVLFTYMVPLKEAVHVLCGLAPLSE